MDVRLKPFNFDQALARSGVVLPAQQRAAGKVDGSSGTQVGFSQALTNALKSVSQAQHQSAEMQRQVQLDNPNVSLNKISEIYDHIAFAGAGKYSEFENLRKAGIRHADMKGYLYSREDVTTKSLANAYSQTLGTIFSQEIKPLEVEILLVGLGRETPPKFIAFLSTGVFLTNDWWR